MEELSKDQNNVFHDLLAHLDAVPLKDDLEVVPDSCRLQIHLCLRLEFVDVRLQFFSLCSALDEHTVGCVYQLDPIL